MKLHSCLCGTTVLLLLLDAPSSKEWSLPLMGVVGGHYRYTADLLSLDSCVHSQPKLPATWPLCPSPVILPRLQSFLMRHPDQAFAQYVYRGFTSGFRIGYDRDRAPLRPSQGNHPSSFANPAVLRSNINSETSLGRVVGPLPPAWSSAIHCSPLGLVPKSSPGKWRTIVDLSSPSGASVNDGIDARLCTLTYASLDDAVELITKLGRGSELVKIDLKDAYRIVPVHPHDHHLLAISWEGAFYIDRCLPFGLRSAPKVFTAVADTLAWCLHCEGVGYVMHYLDDFLLIGSPRSGEASTALEIATRTFQSIGVPVASDKTEGPSTCIVYLGIVIDTMSLQLRLPEPKLQRVQLLLQEWLDKRSCTRRELERLLGHLSHAATIIHPGRIFLRQLFNLLPQARRPFHHVRLNRQARADLRWWQHFLQAWNGIAFFPAMEVSVHIYSDASGSFGCGAFNPQSEWLQLQWPASWGHSWGGCRVLFHVDNLAVVSVLQRQAPRDPLLTHLSRCLCFYAALYHFEFSAVHIAGGQNTAADALSRNNLSLFSLLFPQVSHSPVSPQVASLLLHHPPDWSSPG